MHRVSFLLYGSLLALLIWVCAVGAQTEPVHLFFDGKDAYVEVPNDADFSVEPWGLTVSVWMKPAALTFPKTDGSDACEKFVHWLGKGDVYPPPDGEQQEWVFRIYSLNPNCPTANPALRNPRQNRISFYVFNKKRPEGRPSNLGVGSYFQDPAEPVKAGDWIHVVGVAYYYDGVDENGLTAIYKNGEFKDCDNYRGITGVRLYNRTCNIGRWPPPTNDPIVITPEHGRAPVRMGTRDGVRPDGTIRDDRSFFLGGLARVRIWNRPLDRDEVNGLFRAERCLFYPTDPSAVCDGEVPPGDLVAEWLLNEETGTTAFDPIRGHDGTIFGAFRPVR